MDSTSERITLLVFISRMDDDIVAECNQAAADLRAKSVRLVLLALNEWLDADLMAKLTGDRNTVQFWDSWEQAEPPDFRRWFDYTVGCQATVSEHSNFQKVHELIIGAVRSVRKPKRASNQFSFRPRPRQRSQRPSGGIFSPRTTDRRPCLQRINDFLTSEFFDGWTHPERIVLYFSCISSRQFYYSPDSFTRYTDLASVIYDYYNDQRRSCEQGVGESVLQTWLCASF
jgi:hypothetical protein